MNRSGKFLGINTRLLELAQSANCIEMKEEETTCWDESENSR